LISNFNDKANLQGTGTTIVDVAPNGAMDVFAQIDAKSLPGACPGGVGLTTALAVLKTGWVIVGSLPTKDGTAATAKAGCLIVLNNEGKAVETFYGSLINGPWDMTSIDTGDGARLFVTNVLNGTVAAKGAVVHGGTVLRINVKATAAMMPWIESMTVVGSGFAERSDPAALVIGPTGVGLSPLCAEADDDDCTVESQEVERVLYVADSLNNRVAVIPNALTRTDTAGTGATVSSGGSLNDPLGLTVAPNGHILVVNGNNGFAVEIEPRGGQVARKLLDNTGTPAGAGTLFGLIFDPTRGVFFVDDGTNTLNELH
jgi:DNA-binding beta-propeller fold protein YncE